MTRIAFITDVHADVHALREALVQIERLECDQIICAGDLIDYGIFPEETIALLREHKIPCIRGNHDRWAIGSGSADEPHAINRDAAFDASGWDLSRDALNFLASLPTKWDAVIEGVRIAVRHASPHSDMDGLYYDRITPEGARGYLDEVGADVLILGHTHTPFEMRFSDGGLIANPGALLRDAGEERAQAMLYDPARGTFVPAPASGGGTFGMLQVPACVFSVHRSSDGELVGIPRVTFDAPKGEPGHRLGVPRGRTVR